MPPAQISALQLALSFSLLVGIPMVVVNLVMGPELAQLLIKKNKSDALRLSSRMTQIGLLLSLPLCIVIGFYPDQIVSAVYGVDFVYASSAIVLLALSSLLNTAFGPISYLLTLSGYERQALTGQVIGLLLMVFIVLLLATKYGAVGSVLGVFIGTFVRNIVLSFMSRKYLGAPWSLLIFK
jgi:O-antigen/teichoic acid export membrane protein